MKKVSSTLEGANLKDDIKIKSTWHLFYLKIIQLCKNCNLPIAPVESNKFGNVISQFFPPFKAGFLVLPNVYFIFKWGACAAP